MLNTLIIVILLYLVFRSVLSLYRAIKEDRSAQGTRMFEREAHQDQRDNGISVHAAPPPRRRSTSNVEDAKWKDL